MLRYTNKRMFLLGWSHRYTYVTIVIWLTVMKYSFPICPWIFSPLRRFLSFLSHWQDFCLSSLTDKTFVVPLSLTRFLSFLSHWQDFCLSSLTDKTFVFPLSRTKLLSFLSHWQDVCRSSLTDQIVIFPLSLTRLLSFLSHWQYFCLSSLTDKILIFPLSLTRLLSFLSHWQDLCRSSLTDKTFVFPLSLTRLLSFLSHWQDVCRSSLTDKTLSFLSHWQDFCRTWLWYHGVCHIRNRNSLHFYDEVRLARLFSFLCCVFCFACLPAVNSVQSCMWIWNFHFLLSVEPPSVFTNVYRIPYIYFELILYCN